MSKHIPLFLLIFIFCVNFLHSQEDNIAQKNINTEQKIIIPEKIVIETEYNVPHSTGSSYLSGWEDLTPIIMTYVDYNGLISVCSTDQDLNETYIYEYSRELSYIKTIKLKNVYEKLGAFTKDDEGNYYIFYANVTKSKSAKNMALVKYDNNGEKINDYILESTPKKCFGGVTNPFYAGSCRMELSDSMLAVYFARKMFNGHQASYGFILDKDTFEKIDNGAAANAERLGDRSQIPYASHSLNQFILPVENGFIFVDQGDSYPRNFDFSWFQKGKRTKRLGAFKFKKSKTYQYTFAQIGGLVKAEKGYIFAGTYEKNKNVMYESHNDSRNLFIVTFDEDLTACSDPIWLTNYSDIVNENAANPKIAALDSGRYLLLWELRKNGLVNYKTTYMKIINENGETLSEEIEMPGVYLNKNDVLRYDHAAGTVNWAINDGQKKIILYSLKPDIIK